MTPPLPPHLMRYHRQSLLEEVGVAGQERLLASHALIVGCGALGTVASEMLARAGVGHLTIVDRDIVELTNLQRQVLFDEADVEAMLPKAEAARRKLATINSDIRVDAVVEDFSHRNAERLAAGAGVIVDATDNFEARFLINDVSVQMGVPWVYGGAVAMSGMTMTFLPRRDGAPWAGLETPCLRCVFEEAPPPEARLTCDTVGVLGPVASLIASIEAAEALKVLLGRHDAINRRLLSVDLWGAEVMAMEIGAARSEACPCCGRGELVWLRGEASSDAATLCGREAVQIAPAPGAGPLDLERLASTLAAHGTFAANRFTLRGVFTSEAGDAGSPLELTVFPDGRAIVKGTTHASRARGIYARYIGG